MGPSRNNLFPVIFQGGSQYAARIAAPHPFAPFIIVVVIFIAVNGRAGGAVALNTNLN